MRILKLGCWSQGITSKPAPKGLSIVFQISQHININYFPQNILEVSFSVINTNFRSLVHVSRNAYESSCSNIGIAFKVCTIRHIFCVSQIVFIQLFFKVNLTIEVRGVTSGFGQSHFKMMQSVKNSFFGVLAVWHRMPPCWSFKNCQQKDMTTRDVVTMHWDVKYYVFI